MSATTGFRISALCLLGFAVCTVSLTGCNRDPNVRKQKYFESGKRFESAGKHREAAIQFSNALKIDHNFADAHFELGKVYLKLGSVQAAYSELLKTVDLAPSNVDAHLQLGQLSLLGGLPDKAQEQAAIVLRANPNRAAAYALLSGVAVRAQKFDEARENINKALSIEPNNADFHVSLGLIDETDPATAENAIPELRKAVELDPKNVTAHMALAEQLLRHSDNPGGEQQLQAAISADPKNIAAYAALSAFYMRQQQNPRAEQTLKTLLRNVPDKQVVADMMMDFYTHTGQAQSAEDTFAAWVADNPKNFVANYNYARVLVARNKTDKAEKVLATLTKQNPSAAETALIKSAIQLNQGKAKEALDTLKNETHNEPDNFQLRMSIGRLAFLQGDNDTAMKSFQEAARIAPRRLEPLAGQADIADRRHDVSLLLQLADKALALNSNFEPAYLWRASSHAASQATPEAENDLNKAIALDPHDARPHIDLAQMLGAQHKLDAAAAEFEKALAIDPKSATALHGLLAIDVAQKQPDKALARLKQQIAAAPNDADLYREQASLLFYMKDVAGARDAAQKAVSLNGRDTVSLQLLSQSYVQLGQVDAAITIWKRWVADHPTDAGATTLLGQLLESKDDIEGAKQNYQKALQLDPHQSWAANNLAYLLVEHNGNLDTAMNLAQQARADRAHDPNVADTLAWVYYHKGIYPAARDLLLDAVKSAPDNAAMQYHLGMTYSKLGDRTNATAHLKKAISLGQKTPIAQQAQQALGSAS